MHPRLPSIFKGFCVAAHAGLPEGSRSIVLNLEETVNVLKFKNILHRNDSKQDRGDHAEEGESPYP